LYDPSTGILHFVDINQKRLYHYDTASSTLVFDEFDEPVTALALRQNGQGVSALPQAAAGIDDPGVQLACVTGSGFALIEQDSDSRPKLTYLAQPLSERESRTTRFNDGACDGKGRFLAATLESKHEGNEFGGILYQYDPSDGSCKVLDDQDITDGNGLGWSEDHRTL
jgi:sugar lactone lactonase YvrE